MRVKYIMTLRWVKNKKAPRGIPNTQKIPLWFQNIQNDISCFELNYKLIEFIKLNGIR